MDSRYRGLAATMSRLVALIVLTGCNVKDPPEVASPDEHGADGDTGFHDAGTFDADDPAVSGSTGDTSSDASGQASPLSPLLLAISSPTTEIFINESATFRVAVQGGPDSVWLERNGELLATLDAATEYVWQTSQVTEGTYAVKAVATRGTDRVETAPVTVHIDRTPPILESRVPAHGDDAVRVRAPIELYFSEPIDTSEARLIMTADDEPVETSMTWSEDNTHLTVTLDEIPAVPSTVAVALEGFKDRAQNPLGAPGPWTWTLPAWITEGYRAVEDARLVGLAINDEGTLYISARRGQELLVMTRDVVTGEWTQLGPRVYTGASSHYVDRNHFILDAHQTPWLAVADQVQDPVAGRMTVSYRVLRWNGQSWTPVGGVVNTLPYSLVATLALIPTDPPILVYSAAGETGSEQLYAAQWSESNQDWQALGGAISTHPLGLHWALNGTEVDGTPVISWYDRPTSSSRHDVRVFHWEGSAWVQNARNHTRVNSHDNVSGEPAVACPSLERCLVAWAQGDGADAEGQYHTLRVRRSDGSFWRDFGGILNLGAPSGSYAMDIKIALDPADAPVVAWRQMIVSGGVQGTAHVARWNRDQEAWERIGERIDVVRSNRLENLRLAIDEHGQPVVAFSEERDSSRHWDVYVRRYNQ